VVLPVSSLLAPYADVAVTSASLVARADLAADLRAVEPAIA
jgi:hypothetical protein